jgi:hypothetical protein
MTSTAERDLDSPGAVLASARALRAEADRAEALLLVRACAWADLHPAPDDEVPAFEDEHLPAVAWDAPAEFGAAVGLSTEGARHRIHESLELRHRLPRVWARMLAGESVAWRARRVAQTTMGHPEDVAECVDRLVSPIAHKVGLVTLDRVLEETRMRLYPEQCEQEQLEELDRRDVTLFDQISNNGVGEMRIRADLKDLLDFDKVVSEIAAVLAENGCPDSLDIRRSLAVGVLADPEQAADLLARGGRPHPTESSSPPAHDADSDPDDQDTGAEDPGDDTSPGESAARPARTPRKRAVLVLHLTEAALLGVEPVGRCETGKRPMLEQQIREWCGRTDTHLTVKPVIGLHEHHRVDAYEVPDRISEPVDLRDRTCVFPFCERPARRCDHDHNVPHAEGGATCECNIAPLCRHHHRLKTHTAWAYTTVEPGTYLWRSPHGYQFLRNHTGTRDVTPQGQGDPGDGCHHSRAP